jgi:hypothetical protein
MEKANEALEEAVYLKDMNDDAAIQALIKQKSDVKRALIFDALSRMYPDKAQSMAKKISELEAAQEEPLFNNE